MPQPDALNLDSLRAGAEADTILRASRESIKNIIEQNQIHVRDLTALRDALTVAGKALQNAALYLAGEAGPMPLRYIQGDIAAGIDACEGHVNLNDEPVRF